MKSGQGQYEVQSRQRNDLSEQKEKSNARKSGLMRIRIASITTVVELT